ncbi:MAG: patatin-like phospholipase family protein [Anaerolineae bacterium]
MIDINPQNKKLILSVDGGGMRGMITIAMLAELEALTGKPCHEMFDMVAGTSTGAIIAAGICVGYSAQEILELVYRDRLPNAFPRSGISVYIRYILQGLHYLYDLKPFNEALGSLVQGRKIRDFQKPILLLTTHDVRTSSTLYIVSKGPGSALVADWPLSGSVAASGAAPVYFPPVAGNLIDGGVGVHANPSLAAAIEAMEYLGAAEGFTPGNVLMMSLGTGYTPNKIADGKASKFNLINWIQYVIGETLDEAGLQQASSTRAIYGGDKVDFRRYNVLLTRENVENALGISTVGRPDPNHLGLDSRAPQEIALMEAIGRAYGQAIDWTQSNVMPWDTRGGHPKPDMEAQQIDWSTTDYR